MLIAFHAQARLRAAVLLCVLLPTLPFTAWAEEPAAAPLAEEAAVTPADEAAQAAGLDLFEKKIRPVLVKHCYECHSADAKIVRGGLLLDHRAGLLAGGDSGSALAPGKPDESLLISSLKYESFEMPPDRPLPAAVIADFEEWIRLGAPDPREGEAATKQPRVLYSQEEAAAHWAFQPIGSPDVPPLNDPWVRTPVDAFVLAKLNEAGLAPSPLADRLALIRRAAYSLTGLPPAADEVSKFQADSSPDAFAKVVARLLDSPQYGERWARHWLDVARYADNNGERLAPTKSAPYYPYAWTYRDYVVDAFNHDLPFDQFVIDQLAGDMVVANDRHAVAGLGFLRVGKAFGQNLDDRFDDRIDALSKGLLGLTVSCARCHDHKFDPISTADYYALHGVFASSEEVDPVIKDTAGTPPYQDYVEQRDTLYREAHDRCVRELNEFMGQFSREVADYLIGVEAYRDGQLTEKLPELAAREVGLKQIQFQAWLDAFAVWDRKPQPAWNAWYAFAAISAEDFPNRGPIVAQQVAAGKIDDKPIHPVIAKAFAGTSPRNLREVADIYQGIFLAVEKAAEGRYPLAELLASIDKPSLFRREYYTHPALPPPLKDSSLEELRQVTIGFHGPFFMTPREFMQSGAGDIRKRIVNVGHAIVKQMGEHPGAPVRAMGLRDLPTPVNSQIRIRGERDNLGAEVPRRFLTAFLAADSQPFQHGSGRLELAQQIVSPRNPLTARVIVNRVWAWHFGRGLVTTPSDFGLRSEPPSHPELLDWLARWFMEEGWSLKKLHALILNSSVYQQASLRRADGFEVDPDNRLLWRMNPQRLDFESLRDSLLLAAGRLDLQLGGRPVPAEEDATRRSIYLYVDRYELPDLFATFDFASPEFTTAERDSTIVPQQALFLMNHPFVMDRAADMADRSEIRRAADDAARVNAMYGIVYQRAATPTELRLALNYIQALQAAPGQETSAPATNPWARLAHALLQTNEFVYLR